ncbi:MAG: hypothetical protein J6Y37_07530, partial [Paludibacteraceae bacterium]|nr:hypothetical protein [Paludibacteraceae bacterium]
GSYTRKQDLQNANGRKGLQTRTTQKSPKQGLSTQGYNYKQKITTTFIFRRVHQNDTPSFS